MTEWTSRRFGMQGEYFISLRLPSLIMTNVLIVFENVFKTEINKFVKLTNVRKEFATQLLKLPCCGSLKDKSCECTTIDYVVLMYTTIRSRLHHELKLMNAIYKLNKNNRRDEKRQKNS